MHFDVKWNIFPNIRRNFSCKLSCHATITVHRLQAVGKNCFPDPVSGSLPCAITHTFAERVWKHSQLEVVVFDPWQANGSPAGRQ